MAFLRQLTRTTLVAFVIFGISVPSILAQINYFGVAFQPYTRHDNAAWDSYTVDDIKQMLRIILTNHNAVATYGMGVTPHNFRGPWDKANSNCLIPRAAAQINKDYNSVVLSISQGIYQQDSDEVQNKEIENAFTAAIEANSIFPGTVYNLVFTNEFVTNGDNGPKVLRMIRNNKRRAHSLKLRVGTRIHTCGEIWGGPNQDIIKQIVRESDFIMCNLYPGKNSANPDHTIKGISDAYYSARDGFWRENPHIEVMIGETGWSSSGANFYNPEHYNNVQNLVKFWNAIKTWSRDHKVKVYTFEAFDETWKPGQPGEKTFGWWRRAEDNSKYYTEKATGKRFQ